MNIIETLILFVFSFLLIMLLHIVFINRGRNSYKEGKKITEIHYLVHKYNLDMRKIKYNNLKWATTIANSFIVAFTVTVVSLFESLILQILVGFVLLVVLILPIYSIIGNHYKKQGGKDEQ